MPKEVWKVAAMLHVPSNTWSLDMVREELTVDAVFLSEDMDVINRTELQARLDVSKLVTATEDGGNCRTEYQGLVFWTEEIGTLNLEGLESNDGNTVMIDGEPAELVLD